MNRVVPWVAALTLSIGLAPACLAAYTATAEVNAQALGQASVNELAPVVLGSSDQQRDTRASGTATASVGVGRHAQVGTADAGGGASSWAQVAAGGIQLQATGTGNGLFLSPGDAWFARILGRGTAYAGASFSDGLTFSVPGLAVGAPLTLTFGINVTGSISSMGQFAQGLSGYGTVTDMRWHVSLGNLSDGRSESEYNSNGLIDRSAVATGLRSFVATVGNGVPTVLTMEASVGASAQGGVSCRGCGFAALYAEGNSYADFSHTFAWNGIQGALDAAGNPLALADLQVMSSSGFNYLSAWSAPVPELPSPALMAAGLLVLAGFVGKRRHPR
ncbi:hypothetical protein [Roseateles sp. P5_E4]